MWAQAKAADLGQIADLGCSDVRIERKSLKKSDNRQSLVVPYFGYSVYKCLRCVNGTYGCDVYKFVFCNFRRAGASEWRRLRDCEPAQTHSYIITQAAVAFTAATPQRLESTRLDNPNPPAIVRTIRPLQVGQTPAL